MTDNERRPFVEAPPFKSVGHNRVVDTESGWRFDFDSRESKDESASILVVTPQGAVCYVTLQTLKEAGIQSSSKQYIASREQMTRAFKRYKSGFQSQLPSHFDDSWFEEKLSYILDGCNALLDYRSWPRPKPIIVVGE